MTGEEPVIERVNPLKIRVFKSGYSNKIEDAVIPLCDFYFHGIFDFVSGGHLDRKPKPDPAGVNAILAKASDCRPAIYIGDSDVDIQTGKNAGIDVLSVAWGFRGRKFLEEKE